MFWASILIDVKRIAPGEHGPNFFISPVNFEGSPGKYNLFTFIADHKKPIVGYGQITFGNI